jgi:DNA-binding CsgD family transcriptional regulator
VKDPGAEHEEAKLPAAQPLFLLSGRQLQVLTLAGQGCAERESAQRLGLAPTTVRGHLERARRHLGARSTCQAVARAIALGLIRVE